MAFIHVFGKLVQSLILDNEIVFAPLGLAPFLSVSSKTMHFKNVRSVPYTSVGRNRERGAVTESEKYKYMYAVQFFDTQSRLLNDEHNIKY